MKTAAYTLMSIWVLAIPALVVAFIWTGNLRFLATALLLAGFLWLAWILGGDEHK